MTNKYAVYIIRKTILKGEAAVSQLRSFGHLPDGREVQCIRLTDGELSCEVLTYGSTLRSLCVPDRGGHSTDVVLGFDHMEDYLSHDAHFGGTVGRFANRIAHGRFTLNGVTYQLPCNDGENHLHGGPDGFDRVLWTAERLRDNDVTLFYRSPDGEMGYPGNLEVRAAYALEGQRLRMHWEAVSDRDTLCSLTNHAYWNLSGHGSGDVLDQILQLDASFYTPSDARLIPTGEIAPVADTPMDFQTPTPIGARIHQPFPPLAIAGGYDHNYVLDQNSCARAWSERSGISLTLTTDCPGVQLYTGNFLGNTPPGKNGAKYPRFGGFCLEPQAFPDAPNHSAFPSAVLKAGERWERTTVIAFGII